MWGDGIGLNLIYLQGSDGKGSFYIYMPETGALSPYVTIDSVARSILVLPIDDSIEVPAGFAQTAIQLNGDSKVKGCGNTVFHSVNIRFQLTDNRPARDSRLISITGRQTNS